MSHGIERHPGSKRILVSFACNDPRNGLFSGKASACEIETLYPVGKHPWDAHLSHGDWDGCAFTIDHTRMRFRIHRVWFPYASYRSWVGNWCWDAFAMKRQQAKRLLDLMREKGCWACHEAPTAFCRWWNDGPDRVHECGVPVAIPNSPTPQELESLGQQRLFS